MGCAHAIVALVCPLGQYLRYMVQSLLLKDEVGFLDRDVV